MFILDDILLAPIKGLAWLTKKIKEQAEEEYFNESKVQEGLIELQIQLDEGKITEREYKKQEEKLLERLEQIRKHKEEKAKEEG